MTYDSSLFEARATLATLLQLNLDECGAHEEEAVMWHEVNASTFQFGQKMDADWAFL